MYRLKKLTDIDMNRATDGQMDRCRVGYFEINNKNMDRMRGVMMDILNDRQNNRHTNIQTDRRTTCLQFFISGHTVLLES